MSLAPQAEAKHVACQASRVEKQCSRLERDLEEGSRRLAMAHNEIRRLTDELESAHLTQRAYGGRLFSEISRSNDKERCYHRNCSDSIFVNVANTVRKENIGENSGVDYLFIIYLLNVDVTLP